VLRLIAIAALALGLAANTARAGGEPPSDEPAPPTMGPAGSELPRLPARLSDGSKIQLPPMVVRVEPERPNGDRRTGYIGAGLVVLALVFWWNRRQRDRFEREDAGDAPTRARRRRRNADPDADDLHAAARGDGNEPELPATSPEPPER
jgi:hypothetical protein